MEYKHERKYFKLKSERNELENRVMKIDEELARGKTGHSSCDENKDSSTTYQVKKVVGKKVNREEKDFIDDLRSRNNVLQKENKALQGKLKNASTVLKKYKNELQSLKRRYSRVGRGRPQRDTNDGGKRGGCKMRVKTDDYDDDDFEDESNFGDGHSIDDVAKDKSYENNVTYSKSHNREIELGNEIKALRKENEHLKIRKAEIESNYQHMAQMREEGIDEMLGLRKQLEETAQNLRSMSVQYNSLEAKAQIQLEVQKETRKKLEQCNSYIVELQDELQVLHVAHETASQNARKVEEQKEHVQDLIDENRLLQDNLSKLCEFPFIQDEPSVNIEPSLLEEQIIELEVSNNQYKEQIQDFMNKIKEKEDTIILIRDEMGMLKTQYEELESATKNVRLSKIQIHDGSTQTVELEVSEKKDEYAQTEEVVEMKCQNRHNEIIVEDKSIQSLRSEAEEKEEMDTHSYQSKETIIELTKAMELGSSDSDTNDSSSFDGPLFSESKFVTPDEECKSDSDTLPKRPPAHTTSQVLAYFKKDADVNYIDFLRFVDPPYPILKQIDLLQVMNDDLKQYFLTRNDRREVCDKNIEEGHISEEEFIEAVTCLGRHNNEVIQLNEVKDLYRHIANNGEEKVTLRRILCFLYCPEIENIRKLFFSFRKSSINLWGPFKVADIHRTGYVSIFTFNECLRSVGIESITIL